MISPPNKSLDSETAHIARKMVLTSEFPKYSQIDPRWEFEPGSERTMCGIVCTKSLIDFYSPDAPTPSVHDLVAIVKERGDIKPNGMSHTVEVDLLKAQGLIAWRRNWDAPSSDPTWLIKNENYDDEQVNAIKDQLQKEASTAGVDGAVMASIKASLDNNNPVIASVRAHFGGNTADHQVVVTAISEDGQSLAIMDPEGKPGSEMRTSGTDHFLEFFNHRAIFAKQA